MGEWAWWLLLHPWPLGWLLFASVAANLGVRLLVALWPDG